MLSALADRFTFTSTWVSFLRHNFCLNRFTTSCFVLNRSTANLEPDYDHCHRCGRRLRIDLFGSGNRGRRFPLSTKLKHWLQFVGQ